MNRDRASRQLWLGKHLWLAHAGVVYHPAGFSRYNAEHLPGGQSHLLMGIALGAYGLTQAILQIPAGWLSDRYGRKPIIYISLILFALGSFIAAYAIAFTGSLSGEWCRAQVR